MALDWESIEIVSEESDKINIEAADRMIVFSGQAGDFGQPGPPGPAGRMRIGTVTTLPAGAYATVVNRGSETAAVLDFGIPRGADATGVSWGDITGTLANQADLVNYILQRMMIHLSVTASQGSTVTKADDRIKSTMRVVYMTFGTPGNVMSDVAWTTSAGSVTFTGTFKGATTIDFGLIEVV